MARWKWKRMAIHFLDERENKKNNSICWINGKRGLSLTMNPERVTCKFCQKILGGKNVDEDKTTT